MKKIMAAVSTGFATLVPASMALAAFTPPSNASVDTEPLYWAFGVVITAILVLLGVKYGKKIFG